MIPGILIYQLGDLPCYASVGSDQNDPGNTKEVTMIWVDESYRKKGLGEQMIKLLRIKFPRLTMNPITNEGLALTRKLERELHRGPDSQG